MRSIWLALQLLLVPTAFGTMTASPHQPPDSVQLDCAWRATTYDLQQVALAPDGSIYMTNSFGNTLRHLTACGGLLDEWGPTIALASTGGRSTNLSYPTGVAVSNEGHIYVAEHAGRILVLSHQGRLLETFGEGVLRTCGQIAIGPEHRLYAADEYGTIVVFDPAGHLAQTILDPFHPNGVAVTDRGDIYASTRRGGVDHFDQAGHLLQHVPGSMLLEEFSYAVAVDPAGTVYVVRSYDRRVLRYAPNLAPLGPWNLPPVFGPFSEFQTIAIDRHGKVVVGTFGANYATLEFHAPVRSQQSLLQADDQIPPATSISWGRLKTIYR